MTGWKCPNCHRITTQASGGRNAACDDDCHCSVPVYVCVRCGDSDYGESDEAVEIRTVCKMERAARYGQERLVVAEEEAW